MLRMGSIRGAELVLANGRGSTDRHTISEASPGSFFAMTSTL
jgi:hypothetical protein